MVPPQAFVAPLILRSVPHRRATGQPSRVVRAPFVSRRALFMTAAPGPNPEKKQQPTILDASDFDDAPPTTHAHPLSSPETDAVDRLVEQSSQPASAPLKELKPEAQQKIDRSETDQESQQKPTPKESLTTEKSGSVISVKLSPEDVETARKAREAAQKAAETNSEARLDQQKRVLARVQQLCTAVGTRTKAFELGQRTRAALDTALQNAQTTAEKENIDMQTKLRASASKAAQALGKAAQNSWNTGTVPWLKKKVLPQVFEEVAPATIAASTLAIALTFVALPSLFSGGQPAKETPRKKLDAETITLEKKLQRQRNLSATYTGRSRTQSELFPPAQDSDLGLRPSTPSKTPGAPSQGTARSTTPSVGSNSLRLSEKAEIPTNTPPKLDPESTAASGPSNVAPKIAPKPSAPVASPENVSPSMAMSTVAKALSSRSSLLLSASFDSLKAEPTIVFQVSKEYHRLPALDQTMLARSILVSAQSLGYDNISLVEQGTGIEVAHAGVGVVLEDETENLRAELATLRKVSNKLAIQAAEKEAEVEKLQDRILEERSQFAEERSELEKSIKTLRTENSGLLEDLETANGEIAKMPERFELEQRTLDAERQAQRMGDSVEMLSIQLAKARSEEGQAKQSEAAALKVADDANKEKNAAIASVSSEIEKVRRESELRADEAIVAARKETESVKKESEQQVLQLESKLQESQEQSAKSLKDTTASYEKQLESERSSKEREVQSVQNTYEAKLAELQKRLKTDLDNFQREAEKTLSATKKDASSSMNALAKERDQAKKEIERLESKAQKETNKALKEKEVLQSRISKLEAQVKEKKPSQEQIKEAAEAITN